MTAYTIDGTDKVIMVRMSAAATATSNGDGTVAAVVDGGAPDQTVNSATAPAAAAATAPVTITKKRPSKPQGPEYEFFRIVSERPNGKGYRLRCLFCDAREMNSHAPRMRKHLVYKCTGDVPQHVKDRFRNHKPVYTRSEERGRQSRKRAALYDSDNTDEDDGDGVGDDDEEEYDLEKTKRELQLLLHTQTMRNEETTCARKPIKHFTDEDFERERKELMTKKMRLEVRVLEDQSKFWSKMGGSVDRVLNALDALVECTAKVRSQQGTESGSVPASVQQHLLANQAGPSVLQSAFVETVTDHADGE